MKLSVNLGRAALIAILALGAPTALATLVDQGDDTTLDTDTNLLWLDMSRSLNTSAQSILAGTDTNHLLAAGWSFATMAQINTLFVDAGMPLPFDGTGSPFSYDPAQTIVSLLGETYSFPGQFGDTHGIQAFSVDDLSQTDFLDTPTIWYVDTINIGAALSPYPSTTPSSVANPGLGSWLVKTETVPEPATLALLGVGLASLGFTRRRKPTS